VTDKFRSLLPPNAFRQERALEQATSEQLMAIDTNMVRKVKSAADCPAHLLPWLAWELEVDFWDENWTEEEKRQVIDAAAYVHQHRGTPSAVRRSLSAFDMPTTMIEWWEENPRRPPYTFRIEVYSKKDIGESLYQSIRRQVERAKNLRSQLTTIDVVTDLSSEGAYYIAGAVTAWIDIDIEAGE